MRTLITSLVALAALVLAPAAGAPTVKIVVPARLPGLDVRLGTRASDGDGVGAGRPALRDPGHGQRRRRREAARGSRSSSRAGCGRRSGSTWLDQQLYVSEQGRLSRLLAPGLVARRPANRRARPAVRPAPAGQRRRRPRRAALSRERLDLRRLPREGSPERNGALAAAGRERPPRRRPRAAEPVSASRSSPAPAGSTRP